MTVAKVLAYAGDISRFGSAKALSAFAGVCPQQRLLATSVKGRTLVSKRGHADLRKRFNVSWAKAAVETVALIVQPPTNSVLALDFQDGI